MSDDTAKVNDNVGSLFIVIPGNSPDDVKDIIAGMLAPAPCFEDLQNMVETMSPEGKKMEAKIFKVTFELVEHRNKGAAEPKEHTNLQDDANDE